MTLIGNIAGSSHWLKLSMKLYSILIHFILQSEWKSIFDKSQTGKVS